MDICPYWITDINYAEEFCRKELLPYFCIMAGIMVKKYMHIIKTIRAFLNKISNDHITAFSSQAAFFIILSLFPFLLFLMNCIKFTALTKTDLLNAAISLFPTALHSFVEDTIDDMYEKATGTFLSISALMAIWSAARGFLAITKGLNAIYDIKEDRNYFYLRLKSAIYTMIFSLLIILSLALLVFGNKIHRVLIAKAPVFAEFSSILISFRSVFAIAIFILFFCALYCYVPNRKDDFLLGMPGAIISTTGWMTFSYAFSIYIDNFSNLSYMYGSLATIVIVMLWLYFCMYILFIGAEFNVYFRSNINALNNRFKKRKKDE